MKKIFLFALLSLPIYIQAQTMKELFINIPDSLCVLLTKNNRADFADFLESNMRAQVKNKFDETSEMKLLTKDYLLLETTSASSLQLKLFPVNDSLKVICAVETFKGPVADSHISFYSTDWKKLAVEDYLIQPTIDSFFVISDTIDVDNRTMALTKVDMNLMKADLSPDINTLSFVDTTIEYLDKESADELRPFISPIPVIYYWENGTFIKK